VRLRQPGSHRVGHGLKLYRIDSLYARSGQISYRASVLVAGRARDTACMSDPINIKRYRLTYGGAHEPEMRRWKLRRLPDQRSAVAAAGGGSAAATGGQGNCAMYASPART
jgi:hypothetical protein